MKVVVAGGTGFVGRVLCEALTERGDSVTVLSRRPDAQPRLKSQAAVSWKGDAWKAAVAEADAIVNLAGEPVVGRRWSPHQKVRLWDSRIGTTHQLIQVLLAKAPRKASVLVNASAIGYYGPCGDKTLIESDPAGKGFLSDLCRAWETEALRVQELGMRVVCLRIGLVLAKDGGALAKMLPPFRLGLGGPLGNGRQWLSWIDRRDLVGMLLWALDDSRVSGPVNATAPEPVQMREFAVVLGKVLNRPAIVPVPGFVLRLLLGEMSSVLLDSQQVLPQAAQRNGYMFMQPSLQESLTSILAHR